MHPAVLDGETRRRHGRLICSIFLSGLVSAFAVIVLLPAIVGSGAVLVAVCGVLGAASALCLAVAVTGRVDIAGILALGVGAATLALLLAAAGGLASPVTLLIAALVIEPAWTCRDRPAAWRGAISAAIVFVAGPWLGGHLFATAEPTGWHWIVPAAYFASVACRLGAPYVQENREAVIGLPLVDVMQAVVLEMTRDGDVVSVSDKARSLLGVEPDLLLGAGLFDRINVADRVEYLCALSDLRNGSRLRTIDVKIRIATPDGDATRPFSIEIAAVPDGRLLVILRDIAELASLREAASSRSTRAELSESTKVRFLASVGHELRTPLNAIIGFSDMLAHEMFGTFPDPRQKEYATLIRESGAHLLSVVNSILDVSRIEAGTYTIRPEPYRFAESVELCRSMLAPQAASKQIGFGVHMPATIGEVVADRRAVQQILINLISNAIKFTPEHGCVTLGINRVGSRLHISVSDTGIGIGEEDLQRIGEPFTQIDNAYTRHFEGAGLGLSLVKGLVALHEGSMSIESAPGQGTTVTITLPVNGPTSWAGADKTVRLPAPMRKDEADAARRKTA